MANTISDSLKTDITVNTLNTVLSTRLAPLRLFVTDFTGDVEKYDAQSGKLRNAVISLTTAAAAVQTNPTSFGSAGSTVTGKQINVNLLSAPFGLTYAEGGKGTRLEQMVTASANNLADSIMGIVSALMTAANFSQAYTLTSADIDTTEEINAAFRGIYGTVKKGLRKGLILGSDMYAKAMPASQTDFDPANPGRIRGFDGIYESNIWPANTLGFMTDGTGIGAIARLIDWGERAKAIMDTKVYTIESLGLDVQQNTWYDANARTEYSTFDVVFGAGVYDPSGSARIMETVG